MNPDPPPRRAALALVTPERRADRSPARGAGGDALVARRPVDRPGGPGALRDRGRDPADARLGAAAPARRRRDVSRRGSRRPSPGRRWRPRPCCRSTSCSTSSRSASDARSPAAPMPISRGPRRSWRREGSSATGPPSRCAAGTCPASGVCRSRTAAPPGSRSCHRSSPTRATCCGACRVTPFRGCSATTATGSCSTTSPATTGTTRPSPSCSRW